MPGIASLLKRLTTARPQWRLPRYGDMPFGLGEDPVPACSGGTNASLPTDSGAIEQELLAPHRRPADDEPLFFELMTHNKQGGIGLVTLPMSDTTDRCMPIFTSPVRAADYMDIAGDIAPNVGFMHSSPAQLLGMFRDVEPKGITAFALDRCARCPVFTSFMTRSITSVGELLTVWAISKSIATVRLELLLDQASRQACAGDHAGAMVLCYYVLAHVAVEDPRPHLLLGQLGVATRNARLVGEARAFLRLLKHDALEQRLAGAQADGVPDFGLPGRAWSRA